MGAEDPRDAQPVLAADRLAAGTRACRRRRLRVLMIGDLIGKPGRRRRRAAAARSCARQRGIDFVTANGENVAGGMGLTASTARRMFDAGVDVITSGNHIWDKREIYPELDREERILRPLNYGEHGVPGRGWGIFHAADGTEVAVINSPGPDLHAARSRTRSRSPTRCSTRPPSELPPVRLVDFHCELTSEKNAFGHLPRRARQRRRAARTRTCPRPTSGSCRRAPPTSVGPGHDRAGLTASSASTRPRSCRASSTACPRASRWARARSSSTRCQSTSTPPPAGPSPSSASARWSRSDAGPGGAPSSRQRVRRRPPRAVAHRPARPQPPLRRRPGAGRALPADGARRAAPAWP